MLGLRLRARRFRYGLDYGRMVRGRARFALNEALNRPRTAVYRPRGSDMPISLRHHYSPHGTPSNDTWTLREIFRDNCYLPPARVDSTLRAPAAPRVLDVGANVGLFSAFILGRYPTAEIIAFEPDPISAWLLSRSLESACIQARFEVHQACAGVHARTTRFVPGLHQFSHLADSNDPAAIEVPTLDILPLLAGADLAKIDIEGGEWEILQDERFAALGPRALVMEYHERLCPEQDPRALAERLLRASGYEVMRHHDAPSDWPILWAVKSAG